MKPRRLKTEAPGNVQILWASNPGRSKGNGWSFPRAIEQVIRDHTQGMTCLHLFGGLASFGISMDIDASTSPDIIGDAWLPPFAENSFDVVIIDPPYVGTFRQLDTHKAHALFMAAGYIARRYMIWLHPVWIAQPVKMTLEKGWLVRTGRNCFTRALQIFNVEGQRYIPVKKFLRGPAIKYNRWLRQPNTLPFGGAP